MPADGPLTVIIVGGDALALSTAHEVSQTPDHRVVVLWQADSEFAALVAAAGAEFVAGRPESRGGLEAAGVNDAVSILARRSESLQHLGRCNSISPTTRACCCLRLRN